MFHLAQEASRADAERYFFLERSELSISGLESAGVVQLCDTDSKRHLDLGLWLASASTKDRLVEADGLLQTYVSQPLQS